MNQFFTGASSQAQTHGASSRTRKKSTSKTQHGSKQNQQKPVVIIQQSANNTQKGVKIKKEDLKLIQQYCEQNDLGMIEVPSAQMISQMSNTQKGHKKTKSEGTTPLASSYLKSHFPGKTQSRLNDIVVKQQTQVDFNAMSQQYQQMNPVMDYQKFLEDERLYKQQPLKAKSSMGYYTQSNTPNNNTGRFIPQSKSPDVQQNSSINPNRHLLQKSFAPMVGHQNPSLISQSALSNYQMAQNAGPLLNNRGMNSASQGVRSSSRKKSMNNQHHGPEYSKTPSLHQNHSNPGSIKNLFITKNPSTTSYKLKSSSIQRPVHEQYSIDAHIPDQLNESSVYMYDDPLMRSNNQMNQLRGKSSLGQYASQQHQLHDESYMDASLYEQFIQGPHNISQYSNSKGDVDQSYLQYLTRSVSQNQHQQSLHQHQMGVSQSSKSHHTRANSQYSNHTTQITKKRSQAQTVQSSLNNSGQKQLPDRRMLMGRTPSPNYIKRIAGMMQLPPESLVLQQHLYQNQHNNTSKDLSGPTTKRSTSKQQFSSNSQASSTAQLMGNASINQQMNKSLKQKLAKQYGTNHQVNRYKSGSITTSANTAQNSPSHRGITPKRNSLKQKTIQTIQQQQKQLQQAELEQMAEVYKKQAYLGQVAMNHQNKIRKINQEEEKKALAMISSIDQQMLQKHNISQSSSVLGSQQFYQPMKMIGEIMEEDPQPLSSHEFFNFEDITIAQHEKNKGKRAQNFGPQQSTSNKSFASPASNFYYDGGTGGNKIQNQNQLLLSKNSVLSSETQTYSQNPSQIVPQNDQNQITQYLEQLQQKRQQTQVLKQQSIKSPNNQVNQGKYQSVPIVDNRLSQKSLGYQVSNYQSNQNPIRTKTPSNLIRLIDESERSPTSRLSDQENHSSKYNRKKTQSVEPPKIAAPTVDMFKQSMNELEERLKEHTNFQKKQQPIVFHEKTPFEKELEQKAQEIKKKKQMSSGEVSGKVQNYKMDSIQILKQLQESETIAEALLEEKAQLMKKNVTEYKKTGNKYPKQLQPQLIPQKGDKQDVEIVGSTEQKKKAAPRTQLNSKRFLEDDDIEDKVGDDEILMTQEEEQQIREVISDLNEKAFYGKILKKTKNLQNDDFAHLSPRSREIATVMKFIKQSFDQNGEPPVTTTDFYRIGKMLGRGAFGKVNLAMHKLVRKLVALKSLNKECLTDEAQKNKLMKEVQLLLKLRHNHVIKIYETIETEKHIIIVMELCAGGDLLNYVRKRRRVKEPFAKVIFKQIIDGLCYIHSKYIAHRDIKLDNILLDGKGNVKIADFGISKQVQKGQKMSEQCGTPAYIAPEILKDKGYTYSVDIWSAGVVLFAMLYGTVPFKANNMEELHRLIMKGKYTLKDDISIEARNLLRGLLEVNPEKRLTIKQIYRHKWFADLDPNLQLFNDQEREVIRKEYTYNDPRRYNRNENEEPVDCFTEHHIESVYNSLQNATSKSIILAPFNSTQSEMDVKAQESIRKMLCEKMMVLKFARRCREIDRMYEQNNNQDLDNGVYHNKVYNSDDKEDGDSDGNNDPENINTDLLSIPMLMSERKPKRRGGRASVENSFEEDSSIQKMQDRQQLAKKIKQSSAISRDIYGIAKDVDEELVATYETFQSRYSSNLDEDRIRSMVAYGYPYEYVMKSLEESDPNYCTAGYYLLGNDQNYC